MKTLVNMAIVLLTTSLWQPSTAIAQTDDSILSDTHIVSQRNVEAEVIRVRPSQRTITVKGETRGQTRQFSVPEGARITINGREARLRDLQRGDMINLTFVRREDNVVVDRIRMPDSDVTLEERRAAPVAAATESTPAVLPSTASFFPAILSLGVIFLAFAGLIRRLRVRS